MSRTDSPHDNQQCGTHDHDHGCADHGCADDNFVADYDRYDVNGYAVGGRVWSSAPRARAPDISPVSTDINGAHR
ncbi:hypothetical protein [Nocardia nepalensis]|uniref:hypothetical protein n=1 Tax=Nocardia nepalensis TaxID=3375448 RepID=UPI003B679282